MDDERIFRTINARSSRVTQERQREFQKDMNRYKKKADARRKKEQICMLLSNILYISCGACAVMTIIEIFGNDALHAVLYAVLTIASACIGSEVERHGRS